MAICMAGLTPAVACIMYIHVCIIGSKVVGVYKCTHFPYSSEDVEVLDTTSAAKKSS